MNHRKPYEFSTKTFRLLETTVKSVTAVTLVELRVRTFVTLFASLLATSPLIAADYSGTYIVDDGEYFIQLELQQDGIVRGGMNDDGSIYSFVAQPVEGKIMGAIEAEDGSVQYSLFGQANEQGLLIKIFTEVDQQGNIVESSGQLFQFKRTGNRESVPSDNAGVQPPAAESGGGNSTETTLRQFLAGKHVLFSYRDGGVVYGTYYCYNTHHCPSGRYLDYANSSKQSVLGGQINQNWQSNGTWQVTTYQGQTGVHYLSSTGETTFWPMRLNANGGVYINDTISFVVKGQAQCQ